MRKIALFFPALFLLFTAAANAHGPVRGKMTATVTIDAPAAKIWEAIKEYDDMSWHPAIKDAEADKGNAKGSVRVLTLKDGGTITEELKKHDDKKMTYKYKITEMSSTGTVQHAGQEEEIPVLPVGNYAATLSVKDKGGKSVVTWIATYYRAYVNNNPPEELNEKAADDGVTAVLKSGLAALQEKFEGKSDESAIDIKLKR